MTRARWFLAERDFESASQHFSMACRIFEHGGFDRSDISGYMAEGAFLHAIGSGHTSLESGLKRIFAILGEDVPMDHESWHRDLIELAGADIEGRGRVLPPGLCAHAQETRKMRNVARHNYDFFLKSKAALVIESAKVLAEQLPKCLRDFVRRIDPPSNTSK